MAICAIWAFLYPEGEPLGQTQAPADTPVNRPGQAGRQAHARHARIDAACRQYGGGWPMAKGGNAPASKGQVASSAAARSHRDVGLAAP
jgi:hypothetical protein